MDSQKIGCFLLELRKNMGLTQGELATKFNVTHQSVSKWEKGDSIPDINVLREIANFYGVTIEEILNGEKSHDFLPVKNEKMKTIANFEKTYLAILVGLFTSFGFFYFHEQTQMNINDVFGGFGDFGSMFGDGYVTLNIRGYNVIFNATGVTIFTSAMWIVFLSSLVILTVKILNIYSIVKKGVEHSLATLRFHYNVVHLLETLIVVCYVSMAIAMLFVSSISMGIGFFIGVVFVALIYVLNRIKIKQLGR